MKDCKGNTITNGSMLKNTATKDIVVVGKIEDNKAYIENDEINDYGYIGNWFISKDDIADHWELIF